MEKMRGKREQNWIIPLRLLQWWSLFIQLAQMRKGWRESRVAFCALPERLSGCSWDILCWNILKSIMERFIDLLATPNWLYSAHRTEIWILILHPAAMSQNFKNKVISLWINWGQELYCCQIQQTPMSRKVWLAEFVLF